MWLRKSWHQWKTSQCSAFFPPPSLSSVYARMFQNLSKLLSVKIHNSTSLYVIRVQWEELKIWRLTIKKCWVFVEVYAFETSWHSHPALWHWRVWLRSVVIDMACNLIIAVSYSMQAVLIMCDCTCSSGSTELRLMWPAVSPKQRIVSLAVTEC